MNLENSGIPLFKIKKLTNTNVIKTLDTVYVDNSNQDRFKEILLKEREFSQLIPSNKERDVLYITGASGSGKSYFALQYLYEYHIKYPKNPVYLFSSLKSDETLDKFKNLMRIDLSQDFLETDFVIDDFKDSMVIFDDIDCLQDKKMRTKVNNILGIILETGRHTKTSCIYTSHLPAKGMETKKILNECSSITFFCSGLGGMSLKYLMEAHMGLERDQRKRIKRNNSRATTFCKTFPNIILYDKGAYELNGAD